MRRCGNVLWFTTWRHICNVELDAMVNPTAETLAKAKITTLLDTQSNVKAALVFSTLRDEKAKKQTVKLARR